MGNIPPPNLTEGLITPPPNLTVVMANDSGLANKRVARGLLNDIILLGDEEKYNNAIIALLLSWQEQLLYEVVV